MKPYKIIRGIDVSEYNTEEFAWAEFLKASWPAILYQNGKKVAEKTSSQRPLRYE